MDLYKFIANSNFGVTKDTKIKKTELDKLLSISYDIIKEYSKIYDEYINVKDINVKVMNIVDFGIVLYELYNDEPFNYNIGENEFYMYQFPYAYAFKLFELNKYDRSLFLEFKEKLLTENISFNNFRKFKKVSRKLEEVCYEFEAFVLMNFTE